MGAGGTKRQRDDVKQESRRRNFGSVEQERKIKMTTTTTVVNEISASETLAAVVVDKELREKTTKGNDLIIEPEQCLFHAHSVVDCLVALSDGSFVTCSQTGTEGLVKRWTVCYNDATSTNDNDSSNSFQLAGTFRHNSAVLCAAEKDRNTIITGSFDGWLREWNVQTGECLKQLEFIAHEPLRLISSVTSLLITKNKSNSSVDSRLARWQ